MPHLPLSLMNILNKLSLLFSIFGCCISKQSSVQNVRLKKVYVGCNLLIFLMVAVAILLSHQYLSIANIVRILWFWIDQAAPTLFESIFGRHYSVVELFLQFQCDCIC